MAHHAWPHAWRWRWHHAPRAAAGLESGLLADGLILGTCCTKEVQTMQYTGVQ